MNKNQKEVRREEKQRKKGFQELYLILPNKEGKVEERSRVLTLVSKKSKKERKKDTSSKRKSRKGEQEKREKIGRKISQE